MQFHLLPVIDVMLEYYGLPRGFERFKEYIHLLTGGTDDVQLPIAAFNPMGQEHVLDKLKELKALDAEKLIAVIANDINAKITKQEPARAIRISVSLADDLKGGWTNRYTTDYQARFNTASILKRNFCAVLLWVTDDITKELVHARTLECLYQAIYQTQNPQPETLEDHIAQQAYVMNHTESQFKATATVPVYLQDFYNQNKKSTDYPRIFNFLYGDKAAAELGYSPIGILEDFAGLKWADCLA